MKSTLLAVALAALPLAARADLAPGPGQKPHGPLNPAPPTPGPKPKAPAPATTAAAPAAPLDGQVTGTVSFNGVVPKVFPVPHTKDIGVCGSDEPDNSLLVSAKGGVANAVITLDGAAKKPALATDAQIDQKLCVYSPRVQVVPTGSAVTFINSDPLLHTVVTKMGEDTVFNKAFPLKGGKLPLTLKKSGLYRVGCGVHGWMQAWIVASDSAYTALTDADGHYTLSGVPPGEYTMHIWHEKFADHALKVVVPAKGNVTADLQLKP